MKVLEIGGLVEQIHRQNLENELRRRLAAGEDWGFSEEIAELQNGIKNRWVPTETGRKLVDPEGYRELSNDLFDILTRPFVSDGRNEDIKDEDGRKKRAEFFAGIHATVSMDLAIKQVAAQKGMKARTVEQYWWRHRRVIDRCDEPDR